jgi:cytochrome d ubiquinol oxidase subunit II
MGTVVGAIATGAVPANASHASLAAWTSPTALLSGFLFVAACGYLAAVYLVVEARRRGDRPMRAYFTRRAQPPPSPRSSGGGAWPSTRCCCPAPR